VVDELRPVEDYQAARLQRAWSLIPAIVVVVILLVIGFHAFRDSTHRDFSIYYVGADRAWTGHSPWSEPYWLQLPGVILLLGPVAQVMSLPTAEWFMTLINLVVAVGLLATAFVWLRARCPLWLSWIVVVALAGWGPLAGTFWFKQMNLVVLALALAGFSLLRRQPWIAGLLIGVSIAIKPLVLLLPLFLLFHRETRKAVVGAVIGFAMFTLTGLAVMSARAGTSLDPFAYYHRFDQRIIKDYACNPINASPTGLACRVMGGTQHFDATRALVFVGLAVLIIIVLAGLRHAPGHSPWIFAWACLISPMVSPVTWSHYGVMLAPMFVVLAAYAWANRWRIELWTGLVVAYLLSDAVWQPSQSLVAFLTGKPDTLDDVYRTYVIAATAQFVIIAVALAVSGRDDIDSQLDRDHAAYRRATRLPTRRRTGPPPRDQPQRGMRHRCSTAGT
jgi:uncharacterized membrane protein